MPIFLSDAAAGTSATWLTAKGVRSHEPVADNATEDGREKNPRVELVKT